MHLCRMISRELKNDCSMLMGREFPYALRPKMNIDGKFAGLGSVIVT